MADIERPSDDVLIVHLSPHHSLDLVRVPSAQKYRIVFAERWGVQRRAFVEISYDQACEIAKFFGAVVISDGAVVATISDPSPTTSSSTDPLPLPLVPPRTSEI